ncbi:MAG TPA: peptidylprolyl isomerase, partial [Hyphomicrobiaceae bacterium]|nr:peptidylprolyl isomerase [Hyphomicrobiaceae bacterium]
AYLQRVGQMESTTTRLKGILEDVIKSNPGKTRDQIIALFEERKKAFVMELQKQAIASARAGVVPTKRKEAENEIIEERLKLQEAKRLGVVVTDDDVDRVIKQIADKNKMTVPKFAEHMKSMGADIAVMRSRFRATLAWREVIRRRFGPQIAISNKEIDAHLAGAGAGAAGADSILLHVHRFILPVSGANQAALAQRFAEAQRMQKAFAGCKSSPGLVKAAAGARFEDLGFKPTGALPVKEETRTFLLTARDGEMVPPSITAAGIELFAVCARRVTSGTDAKREKAQEELMMREFETYSKRHLRFLLHEAQIHRQTPVAPGKS